MDRTPSFLGWIGLMFVQVASNFRQHRGWNEMTKATRWFIVFNLFLRFVDAMTHITNPWSIGTLDMTKPYGPGNMSDLVFPSHHVSGESATLQLLVVFLVWTLAFAYRWAIPYALFSAWWFVVGFGINDNRFIWQGDAGFGVEVMGIVNIILMVLSIVCLYTQYLKWKAEGKLFVIIPTLK